MGQRFEMVNANGERASAWTGISWWTLVLGGFPILSSVPLYLRGDIMGAARLLMVSVLVWVAVVTAPIFQVFAFAFWISAAFWVNDRHYRWLKSRGYRKAVPAS